MSQNLTIITDALLAEIVQASQYEYDTEVHAGLQLEAMLRLTSTNFAATCDRLGYSADAAETVTRQLGNELIAMKKELLRTEFGQLKAITLGLVPLSKEPVSPGAEKARFTLLTDFGVAEIIANGADDFPDVDLGVEHFDVPLISIGITYSWTWQDAFRIELQKVSIIAEKPRAARAAHERKQNQIAFLGAPTLGFSGLVNNPNVTVTVVDTGSWDLIATAPEAIVLDLLQLESTIIQATRENHYPDTLLIPGELWDSVAGRPYSDEKPEESIWSVFQKRSRGAQQRGITWLIETTEFLVDSGGAGVNQVLMYERSVDVVEVDIPLAFSELAPVQGIAKITTPTVSRMTFTVFIRPTAATYSQNVFS